MKNLKLMALILSVVMVIGLLPISVSAADGLSANFNLSKRCTAIYNDADGSFASAFATTDPWLYGTGEYGQKSSMAFYSIDTSTIKNKIPSEKKLKRVLFAILDSEKNTDTTNKDTGIRIYAHKVVGGLDKFKHNTHYTNGTGPDYIDTPFAESIYNNYRWAAATYSSTHSNVNHDYYIDITDYYLEASENNETTISFGISSSVKKPDETSINKSDACLFNVETRMLVEYSDTEQTINRAPAVNNITMDKKTAVADGKISVSAEVIDDGVIVPDENDPDKIGGWLMCHLRLRIQQLKQHLMPKQINMRQK